MRKIFVLIAGLHFCCAYAQQLEDPTVMTVAGVEVPLSEFLFLAQKDNEVNLLDKKSLENYVELFKNFKLKVADAKSARIQESRSFQEELATYHAQLLASYLSDKAGEEQVIRKVYERGKEVLTLSHIMFKLPEKSLPKDTLEVFNKANAIYKRIVAGEDFNALGQALKEDENSEVIYEEIDYVFPLQAFMAFEEMAYSLSEGKLSTPVRTPLGFHIILMRRKTIEPGSLQVAHILFQSAESAPEDDEALLKRANEVYAKIKAGEDFGDLVKNHSADESTRFTGGILPYFSVGSMVLPFEQAAFALENIGDLSEPVQSRFGYHIIQLLDKQAFPSFEEMAQSIYSTMNQSEWNHELKKSMDERLKEKFGFICYPEAYEELLKLCDDYFPTDQEFYDRASKMTKPIMRLNTIERDFPQDEFAAYMRLKTWSKYTYSKDYLNEMFIFFVREILTTLEKTDLEEKNPEFRQLMNEYHDGILLFEISTHRVWSQPVEEQAKAEQEWIKELNETYKVEINWNVLNNLKN